MKISVIIATYNRNKILCDTIEQVLNQHYEDFELLIIDQTQKHDEYTANYLTKLQERVKVVKVENPNLPAARNIGIKKSKGDIIIFFDDDMIIPQDTLKKVQKAYDNKNIHALTGFVLYPGQNEETKWFEFKSLFQRVSTLKKMQFIPMNNFHGYFMSFRRKIFSTVDFFDEWIGTQPMAASEDFEFSYRVRKLGYELFLDTGITLIHLGEKTGGCNRRSLGNEFVNMNQLRMYAYSLLKNNKEPFIFILIPIWHFLRSTVLNSGYIISKSRIKKLKLATKSFSWAYKTLHLQN